MTWQHAHEQAGVQPACDRCGDAWWTALGEAAPVYPSREDGALWLAEIYGWYTDGPRLLCPPCSAVWCAGLGHPWHRCPPMQLGGQLVDPALRYCTRCGAWEYLTDAAESADAAGLGDRADRDVTLTPDERRTIAELERQFDSTGGDAR